MTIEMKSIGVIHTPYTIKWNMPYQPTDNDIGEFNIEIEESMTDGLDKIDKFRYIYLLYHIDRITRPVSMTVTPPWAPRETEVGLFASRSPVRPNSIGLSVVRLLRRENNILYTSGLDVLDGTPLLDIKPYLADLDSKPDANHGWIDEIPDNDHLLLHIKGVPHDY